MIKPNYLSWHYQDALPSFFNAQIRKIAQAAYFFNFLSLILHLFSPYRRLVLSQAPGERVGFLNRLSFNLISRIIGAIVRLLIIVGGFTIFLVVTAYYLATIALYLVFPPISLPKYLELLNHLVSQSDITSPENFAGKLLKNKFFKTLSLFFDDDFQLIFDNLDLKSFGVEEGTRIEEALVTLSNINPKLQIYLEQNRIRNEEFQVLISSLQKFLAPKLHSHVIPLGETLGYGYTNNLNRYSIELSRQNLSRAQINHGLLEKIEKVLSRPQDNNVLLVGEPGVGRHTTLNMIATAIQRRETPTLSGRRLMLLDTTAIAASYPNIAEAKAVLSSILEEAMSAGNIILAVDQIERISDSQDGHLNLSESLVSHLRSGVSLIGITTLDDYNHYVRTNAPLIKLFEKIDIPQASEAETLSILIDKALEEQHKEKITFRLNALTEILKGSSKLLSERKQPEKSIIFFNDIVGSCKAQKRNLVDPDFVEDVLSTLTPIPTGKVGKNEAEKLKNLEELLHERVVGQDEAIEEIAKAMRRARAELETGSRPIGSFLFLGPTGVGKTETAKALAQTYFGDENNMVRIDMSEYQGVDALEKLIGDTASRTPGILTSQIRQQPFSLLLLDEFEKANSSVHNLFLQVLDEGFLTDALGQRVSFNNNIIIATSNAGAEFIREQGLSLDKGNSKQGETLSKDLINHVLQKGLFSPELINRFDGVVVYKPLSSDEVVKVSTLMLNQLAKKLKEGKNIKLEVTQELAQKVATAGFDPQFGARPLRRFIQDKIEDEIAKMILDEKVKEGDTIDSATLLGVLPSSH